MHVRYTDLFNEERRSKTKQKASYTVFSWETLRETVSTLV